MKCIISHGWSDGLNSVPNTYFLWLLPAMESLATSTSLRLLVQSLWMAGTSNVIVLCRNQRLFRYFDCIAAFEVSYCIKGGAHTRFLDAWTSNESMKCVWTLPLTKLQQYDASNMAMWLKYVAEYSSISTWDWHKWFRCCWNIFECNTLTALNYLSLTALVACITSSSLTSLLTSDIAPIDCLLV